MVAMGGIALATAALVVVMSVFNGFHSLISERLSALEPPLTAIAAQGKTIASADSLAAILQADPAIAKASPVIEERALAIHNGRQQAVRLRGIRQELYGMFDSICPAGIPWQEYYPGRTPGVVSVGTANALELPIGSEQLLELYMPRRVGRINPANPITAFRADTIAPSAAYIVNQAELDADIVYVPYSTAANLMQLNNEATEIYIYPAESQTAAIETAQRILGPDIKVETLLQRQGVTFQIVNMEKWMTFLLLGFILLIASFNIISSLSLLIIEKEPNAAMLRALGATDGNIRNIYTIVGVLITGIGTLSGLVGGTALSLGQQHFGWVKLVGNSAELSIQAYPVQFQALDLPAVAAMALIAGLVTTVIATRR
ncbi:MAG: ABC transporter permease [Muribaculaceae bacterium]|nr:ABC transporter permease [Muribaculaceae bacterium]